LLPRSAARFAFRHNLYKLREERTMAPVTFAHFVSALLYEKRFGPYYCEPVIAGLQPDGTPFVTGMDLLGALAPAEDFVVSGNNTDALLGVCESMYRPGLEAEDLFEVISQCLLAAGGRDCLSGWGGVVHVITKQGVITRTLRGRMD
jgi:20S proteasome subunit beta 3